MEAIAGLDARSDKTLLVMPLPYSFLFRFISTLLKKPNSFKFSTADSISNISFTVRHLNPMWHALLYCLSLGQLSLALPSHVHRQFGVLVSTEHQALCCDGIEQLGLGDLMGQSPRADGRGSWRPLLCAKSQLLCVRWSRGILI